MRPLDFNPVFLNLCLKFILKNIGLKKEKLIFSLNPVRIKSM